MSVAFFPVHPKAGETGPVDFRTDCTCAYEPWVCEASLALREEIVRRGYKAPKPRISACMVDFDATLVISWDGSLYKCPAFMAYPELQIGTLAGCIADYRQSHNVDVWKKEECYDCAYLPICFGGCRLMTLMREGGITGVDCRKDLYDTILEGMVRQDLEFQRTKPSPSSSK